MPATGGRGTVVYLWWLRLLGADIRSSAASLAPSATVTDPNMLRLRAGAAVGRWGEEDRG